MKSHVVVTGIQPICCYGVELLPVGQHHLDALRIQIADAIQGSSHNRNSAMAVLTTPHLQDPTVILLVRVFKSMLTQPQ